MHAFIQEVQVALADRIARLTETLAIQEETARQDKEALKHNISRLNSEVLCSFTLFTPRRRLPIQKHNSV